MRENIGSGRVLGWGVGDYWEWGREGRVLGVDGCVGGCWG